MNIRKVEQCEDSAVCHCPGCGRRLEEDDVNTEQCASCAAPIVGVVLENLPRWQVVTDKDVFEMHAESAVSLWAGCAIHRVKVKEVRPITSC